MSDSSVEVHESRKDLPQRTELLNVFCELMTSDQISHVDFAGGWLLSAEDRDTLKGNVAAADRDELDRSLLGENVDLDKLIKATDRQSRKRYRRAVWSTLLKGRKPPTYSEYVEESGENQVNIFPPSEIERRRTGIDHVGARIVVTDEQTENDNIVAENANYFGGKASHLFWKTRAANLGMPYFQYPPDKTDCGNAAMISIPDIDFIVNQGEVDSRAMTQAVKDNFRTLLGQEGVTAEVTFRGQTYYIQGFDNDESFSIYSERENEVLDKVRVESFLNLFKHMMRLDE